MAKMRRWGVRLLKWLLVGALLVECFSFLLISTSNYLMHGHFREGSAVR